MKHWLLILSLNIITVPAISQYTKKNVVKINALGLVFGLGSFVYERQLSPDFSISITPSIGLYNTNKFDYEAYGIGGEFRYYFLTKKPAPKGLHVDVGGNALFGNASGSSGVSTYETKVTGFNTYLNLGYQLFYKKHVSIDVGGGVQYVQFKFPYSGGIDLRFLALKEFLPNAVLSLGYAF